MGMGMGMDGHAFCCGKEPFEPPSHSRAFCFKQSSLPPRRSVCPPCRLFLQFVPFSCARDIWAWYVGVARLVRATVGPTTPSLSTCLLELGGEKGAGGFLNRDWPPHLFLTFLLAFYRARECMGFSLFLHATMHVLLHVWENEAGEEPTLLEPVSGREGGGGVAPVSESKRVDGWRAWEGICWVAIQCRMSASSLLL